MSPITNNNVESAIAEEQNTVEDIDSLRLEHFRLCSIVRLADSATAPIVGVLLALFLPVVSICLYLLVHKFSHSECGEESLLLFMIEKCGSMRIQFCYWLIMASVSIAALTLAGGLVSDQVNAARHVVAGRRFPHCTRGSLSMMALLMQVSDTTASTGMTAGHVFVLNKTSLLTVSSLCMRLSYIV